MTLAYVEPDTVEEAVALLAEDEGSKVLAGGQSLMVLLRQGLVAPSRLVSLQRIPELGRIQLLPDGSLRVGCMATYREVAGQAGRLLPAVADACRQVGPIPVQNVGTPGGSLCHNAPGADVPAALLALDAQAVVRSGAGERTIPLAGFFRGYFETVLEPAELLVGIHVPKPAVGATSAYVKFNFRLIDMAIVGVAVAFRRDGEVCLDVRIAVGGVAEVPFRARAAEQALEGRALTAAVVAEAGRLAATEREPVSDVHASAAYRRRVTPVIVKRALERAAGGGGSDVPPALMLDVSSAPA